MSKPPPATKTWWLVGTIAALAVVAMVFASLSTREQNDRAVLAEFLARVEQRSATPRRRDRAVFGDLHDGEAFDHYETCRIEVDRIASRFEDLERREAEGAVRIEQADLRTMRVDWQAAIAAMRRAAHCRTVARNRLCGIDDVWSSIAGRECCLLLDEGRHDDAVRTWLDAMVGAVDLDLGLEPFGGLVQLWTDERMAVLPAAPRQELRQGIGWLDEHLAVPIDWQRRYAPVVRVTLSGTLSSNPGVLDVLAAWDTGFSPQRKAIKGCLATVQSLPLLSTDVASFAERQRQFAAFEARSMGGSDPSAYPIMMRYMEIWRRSSLARLRLLAYAVDLHAGAMPEPATDPLGEGAIEVVQRAGRCVLSAGEDLWRIERVVVR